MVKKNRAGDIPLQHLLREIRSCRHCADTLPLGPNPVLRAAATARLLIVGQAPGTRVHASALVTVMGLSPGMRLPFGVCAGITDLY